MKQHLLRVPSSLKSIFDNNKKILIEFFFDVFANFQKQKKEITRLCSCLLHVYKYGCLQLCVFEMFESLGHVCRAVIGHSRLSFSDTGCKRMSCSVDHQTTDVFHPYAWLHSDCPQRKREKEEERNGIKIFCSAS